MWFGQVLYYDEEIMIYKSIHTHSFFWVGVVRFRESYRIIENRRPTHYTGNSTQTVTRTQAPTLSPKSI